MKKLLLTFLLPVAFMPTMAQTITYAAFSQALTVSNSFTVANNSSFNPALSAVTGNGVSWNAAGLTAQTGMPTVTFSYNSPSSTPYAALYPSANYAEYDPALTSVVAYNYYGFSADSIVEWGSYDPSTQHEVFQNPDKQLVFPFSFGNTFTDTYAKTNYSNATTVSSYQNGTRTVVFSGFGTLTLPQGTFTDVCLVSETRTNNLGPDSYTYTWYQLGTGKRLLYRDENGSSITTAFTNQAPSTGLNDSFAASVFQVSPNPAQNKICVNSNKRMKEINLYNMLGELLLTHPADACRENVFIDQVSEGVYVIEALNEDNTKARKKVLITGR
jgi:hypothetical protein